LKTLLFYLFRFGLLPGIALACFYLLPAHRVYGDSTWVHAVQIVAATETSPPQIHLNWIPDQYGAISYTVFRKGLDETNWGWGTVLSGSTTNFTDAEVEIGKSYEYQVVKRAVPGYVSYGYIHSGIEVPEVHSRGAVAVIIADYLLPSLSAELDRLDEDLTGDGWFVLRHVVTTNQSPAHVRSLIVADYQQHTNLQAVLLIGRVPILHSGNLNYDEHLVRPMPADAYYGDVDGDWSGNPDYLPSNVELMVGRVDLRDMPGMGSPTPFPNEIELTRNYLNKDHAWRHGLINVPRRALMGDRRGVSDGFAPASSGFRAFDPLLGHGATTLADTSDSAPANQRWISRLAAESYLWAYGCAGGQYTGISHLGTRGQYFEAWTIDVVNRDAKAMFVMLFGSWFGNWDCRDNFQRAFLATPTMGLACMMSGEPHWFLHHMGMGEPIGYSTRLTMNNSTLYQSDTNTMQRAIYIALMGDPTLRMHPFAGVTNLSAAQQGAVRLTWSSTISAVLGYHVYRAETKEGPFMRLTPEPVPNTEFVDPSAPAGESWYMVRAVREKLSPSGTFLNLSQGAFASVNVQFPASPIHVRAESTEAGLLLTWNTQPGISYRVFASDLPWTTNWTDLSGAVIASADTMSWHDVETNLPQRFYRIGSP